MRHEPYPILSMVLFTKLLTKLGKVHPHALILSMVLFTKLLTEMEKLTQQIVILSMVLFTKLLTKYWVSSYGR